MITDAFDKSEVLFGPKDFYGEQSVMAKVWTTDAIYRETTAKLEARKKEGCVAVEMELAGVQAVCDFYEWDL